jgi:AP2 domain
MSDHTKRVAQQVWDALGASIFKGSIMERIEAVIIQEFSDLEESLLNIGSHPPYADGDKRSAYMRGYNDAIKAAVAAVRERKALSADVTSTQTIPLTHGKSALVDPPDYDLLVGFRWRAIRVRNTWYAHTRVTGGAEAFMHDLIMGTRPGEQIDHKSGDGLDNRRSNLRRTTNALNQANRRRVRSSSGFKGVSKRAGRWRAYITVAGEFISLGSYATPEEAARRYDAAARERFGEFACTNAELGLLSRCS